MQKKNLTDYLVYAAIAVLLFGMGYKFAEVQNGYVSANNSSPLRNITKSFSSDKSEDIDFTLFWETWNQLENKYIDETKVDKKKMYYGAIKGMVASLEDPYTYFLTPEENKQSKDDLGGKFEGIGAQLGLKENRITVIAPMKNSPAEKAGIRAGDFIIAVDGESTQNWTLTQTVSKIRGKGGTNVTLTIERNSKEQKFTLTRQQIIVPSVELTYETQNGAKVAHLKLNQFGETTNDEWDKAVDDIEQQYANGQIKGMVLDLRDNPGGYLDSSVYIASEFLEKGKMIVKQESTQMEDKEYLVRRNGRLLGIPLTVLINKGSASASEILSGALRDYNRATLIGEKSFGKGSVQQPMDLKEGAGLHVTIAKWLLPKGEWINGKGIEPNIKVTNELKEGNTMTREQDKQLDKAIETVLTK